jgi:hypothetical protein
MQATPTQQPRPRLPGEALGALWRGDAFAMHVLGALRKAVAGPAQAINAGHKGGDIGELVVTRHGTTSAMRAGHPPHPLDRHSDLCTVLVHLDGDAIHQHTPNFLAVLWSRCRGVPQGWDVVSQAQARLPLPGRHRRGPLAAESRLRLVQLWCVPERLFPAPLPLTGDEAVFGLDGCVVAGRPLRLVARALQPLVPMGLSARAVSAQRLLRRHTPLSRRGLEHRHDLRGDKALQERSSEAAAPRRPVIHRGPQARVAQMMGLAPVGGHQAPPAAPTHEQADP